MSASSNERELRAFHALRPGVTSRAFARTRSYAVLADAVRGATRVLDLACGDRFVRGAIGLDLSLEELAGADRERALAIGREIGSRVQGRAQALPFRDASFDACVCHLAFMLFDDIEQVVAELARVIAPGGLFAALLGGGPVEDGPVEDSPGEDQGKNRDAFHRFLAIARPHLRSIAFGDARARSERGWRELFAGWDEPRFERIELELGGTFDEAWDFLGASYQLDPAAADRVREALLAEVGERVSCRVACYLATVRR